MSKKINSMIYKKLKTVDVVSFDIFDTLLIRPYVKPTDLFLHMEKYFKADGFAKNRIEAELKARAKKRPDVTLNDIYNEIEDAFKFLKEKEILWEEMVLRPRPGMLDLWKEIKNHGKRIIVASDMYLPTEVIERILYKNGFIGYDRLYVSGDLGITKEQGKIFEAIVRAENVNPGKILHIGDNRHSDYTVPASYGIKTILVPKIFDLYIEGNIRVKKYLDTNKENIGASIIVSLLAAHADEDTGENYWQKLGFEYCGPTVFGYTRWIEKEVQNNGIDNLLFVARDGYTLHRVFNIINKDIKNNYVYAPRFMNNVVNTKDKSGDSYKKYLNSLLEGNDNIAVVDTISSGKLSSQTLLEECLNTNILGLYWSVEHVNNKYKYVEFRPNNIEHHKVFTKNWNFMEFLMTAPEYPIKGLDEECRPIYPKKVSKEEKRRKELYVFVSDSAVEFANKIYDIFADIDVCFTDSVIIDWINCLCDYPVGADIKNMCGLKHAYDAEHTMYIPLFCDKISLKSFLLNPFKIKKMLKNRKWRTRKQNLIMVLLSPVKIGINGIKRIRIYLFPKMKRRYIDINISLFGKYSYKLVIGNKEDV